MSLSKGLARWAFVVQDYELTRRLLRVVADAEPQNTQVRLLLFDVAWEMGRVEVMEAALKEVENLEQSGPLWHYGEASASP